MSDELRDRIEQVIDRAIDDWMNDPRVEGRCNEYAAQAIINNLGLSAEEENEGTARVNESGSLSYGVKSRVVGRWEKK